MNLAISNIAWKTHDDADVLAALRNGGVTGIEVAPTKIWPDWVGSTCKSAVYYRNRLVGEGFEIPAMQAILFGRPDLQLFDVHCHTAFLDHIKLVADLASGFGAKVLVLGAPKNRQRGQLSVSVASRIAVDFMRQCGEVCSDRGCCIGLEHNPVEYGCDFVTNVSDAREIVDAVNHEGIKLHLDSAGVHMCGGRIEEVIAGAGPFVHYHISEPMLEPIANGQVDHSGAISTLKRIGYEGWVSIEMKQPATFQLVKDSLRVVNDIV